MQTLGGALPSACSLIKAIYEIDSIVETRLFALIDKRCAQGDSKMGFAGSSAADKNQIVGIRCKLAGAKLFNLRLFHGSDTVIKRGKILVMRELCNAHLVSTLSTPWSCTFRFW